MNELFHDAYVLFVRCGLVASCWYIWCALATSCWYMAMYQLAIGLCGFVLLSVATTTARDMQAQQEVEFLCVALLFVFFTCKSLVALTQLCEYIHTGLSGVRRTTEVRMWSNDLHFSWMFMQHFGMSCPVGFVVLILCMQLPMQYGVC